MTTHCKQPIRSAAAAFLIALTLLLAAPGAFAADEDKDDGLPAGVEDGLSYMLGLVETPHAAFDPARVGEMLDFVTHDVEDDGKLIPKRRDYGRGACVRSAVHASLARIIEYFYNPDIPNYTIIPSVVRLSGWYPGSELLTEGRELWTRMDDLQKPVVLWGKEFEVNTPDSFGGAYYRYDLLRLIVLLKHNGHNVLISASRQVDRSDVGRKAVILDDADWDYFYSGIEGLNAGLISWADTYMYGSGSVQVFYESDADAPQTVNMVFKWLRAGWAGANMVRSSHIHSGAERFLESFRKVIESDALPEPRRFASDIAAIEKLPQSAFDGKVREYARKFEKKFKDHQDMQSSAFQGIIKDGGYADVLDREERLGTLIMEYVKQSVGKPALVTFDLPEPKPLAAPGEQPPAASSARTAAKPGVPSVPRAETGTFHRKPGVEPCPIERKVMGLPAPSAGSGAAAQ